MSTEKSYPEEIFAWRLRRLAAAPRAKLPTQVAVETCHRVNARVGVTHPPTPAAENSDDPQAHFDPFQARVVLQGPGGATVVDATQCIVSTTRGLLERTLSESCGDCTFCRIGTTRMHEMLTKICAGQGESTDIDTLGALADHIACASACDVGKQAARPVRATLRHFRSEYEQHIRGERCRAGSCEGEAPAPSNDQGVDRGEARNLHARR